MTTADTNTADPKPGPTEFRSDDLEGLDTAEMVIKHPITGVPTSWVWTIASPTHPVIIALDADKGQEAVRERAQREQQRLNGKKVKVEIRGVDEIKRENAEYFAHYVLGWSPVVIDGQAFPYSRENVITTLMNPKRGAWYQQLLEFIEAATSFMKRSAKD